MKQIFPMKYLSVFLVLASSLSLNSTKVLLAQTKSAYDQYMQLGYTATAQRNYPSAFSYFKQALQARPGDKYANAAVNNVKNYVQRGRRASLAFVSNVGRPGRRISAASRSGSCVPKGQRPIALVPETDPQLTTAGHPTFFIYVPQNSAQALEFILQQDNTGDRPLYKTTLKPNKTAGVVSVSFPSNSNLSSLETDKEYPWSFSVVCDTENRDKDLVVESSIKRIQPDSSLSIQLQKLQPRERASLYATFGFWPDTLTIMADLRRSRPNDSAIKTDWEDLLKSVGLEKITQAPLL
jgi:Domain of Unknown Function (DUF928)